MLEMAKVTAVDKVDQDDVLTVVAKLGRVALLAIRSRLAFRERRNGIGLALGITSALFLIGAALVFTLPDRSGQALE